MNFAYIFIFLVWFASVANRHFKCPQPIGQKRSWNGHTQLPVSDLSDVSDLRILCRLIASEQSKHGAESARSVNPSKRVCDYCQCKIEPRNAKVNQIGWWVSLSTVCVIICTYIAKYSTYSRRCSVVAFLISNFDFYWAMRNALKTTEIVRTQF